MPYMHETELTTITSFLLNKELVAFNLNISISSLIDISFSIKVSVTGK